MATEENERNNVQSNHKREINVEYVVNGELLVIRRFLNVYVSEDDVEQEMENIFHIRCHIINKICSIIIDNGSFIVKD